MNTVFIYALNCPITGRTRYVGKTNDLEKRVSSHLSKGVLARSNHRTCWIRSLISQGLKPVVQILDEVDENFWPQWEVAWIEFFREQGCDLVNASFGGEGGINPSLETRSKIGAGNRGKKISEEARRNIGAARKGKKHSAEARAKISKALIGNKYSLGIHPSVETRDKIRASLLGKKRGPYKKSIDISTTL